MQLENQLVIMKFSQYDVHKDHDSQHTILECEGWKRERSELTYSLREIALNSLVPMIPGSVEA